VAEAELGGEMKNVSVLVASARGGAFPDCISVLAGAARLRHVGSTRWDTKRYRQMSRLAKIVDIA
jgi:hypothetical protein